MQKDKLLIVDDQHMYLKSLALPLQKEYSIRTAVNLKEAMEILKAEKIDLALIDIRLDEEDEQNTDGLTILNWIKENQRQVIVFAMSAYRDFEYEKKAMCSGAKHFFKKPIDILNLITTIREIFQSCSSN